MAEWSVGRMYQAGRNPSLLPGLKDRWRCNPAGSVMAAAIPGRPRRRCVASCCTPMRCGQPRASSLPHDPSRMQPQALPSQNGGRLSPHPPHLCARSTLPSAHALSAGASFLRWWSSPPGACWPPQRKNFWPPCTCTSCLCASAGRQCHVGRGTGPAHRGQHLAGRLCGRLAASCVGQPAGGVVGGQLPRGRTATQHLECNSAAQWLQVTPF